MIALIKSNIITVIIILILIIGLAIGLFLVQQQQKLKSRASNSWVNAFEIKDKNGNTINCDSSTNPPTCTTTSLDVNFKVKDINALLPE